MHLHNAAPLAMMALQELTDSESDEPGEDAGEDAGEAAGEDAGEDADPAPMGPLPAGFVRLTLPNTRLFNWI